MSRLPATPARRRLLKLLGGVASLPLSARLALRRVRPAMRCRPPIRCGPGPRKSRCWAAPRPPPRSGRTTAACPVRCSGCGRATRCASRSPTTWPSRPPCTGTDCACPNAMDGVPALTQSPIAARGGTFDYAFACPDAGTFWYHPHLRGHVQVAMGLHGVLVVEEPVAPDVDRDVVWVLDDWRLTSAAQVRDDFDSVFDATHAGRHRRHGHGERRPAGPVRADGGRARPHTARQRRERAHLRVALRRTRALRDRARRHAVRAVRCRRRGGSSSAPACAPTWCSTPRRSRGACSA